jgi:hypothetical protein
MRMAPASPSSPRTSLAKPAPAKQAASRFSVVLAPGIAAQVQELAVGEDVSLSKAIAELVIAGLAERSRKQKFLHKLNRNLADTSPANEDRLVDEFRSLILGR